MLGIGRAFRRISPMTAPFNAAGLPIDKTILHIV
jgi:hypothetical protein